MTEPDIRELLEITLNAWTFKPVPPKIWLKPDNCWRLKPSIYA